MIQVRRVLYAFLMRHQTIGYTQGMNYIVVLLLCFMEEELAFWTLCVIVEELKLPDFFKANTALLPSALERMRAYTQIFDGNFIF